MGALYSQKRRKKWGFNPHSESRSTTGTVGWGEHIFAVPQPASRTGNEICLMMQLLQTQPEMLPKHSGKEKRKKVIKSSFMRLYISIIEKNKCLCIYYRDTYNYFNLGGSWPPRNTKQFDSASRSKLQELCRADVFPCFYYDERNTWEQHVLSFFCQLLQTLDVSQTTKL